MTSKEKQEYAYLLYCKQSGITLKEIAKKVDMSVKSISRWKKENKWDELRKSMLVTRGEQIRRLYDQLDNLTQQINTRDKETRFPTKSESDIITQLTNAIAKLERELSISDVIHVFIPFIQFVAKVDTDKAKQLVEFQDMFIKSLMKWPIDRR